jgi:hypothetical protein
VIGAVLLATLVTLLVVRGGDDGDDGQLTAGTSTSSSSSTSTSTSTSTSSTTVAATTTTPSSVATATTAPATTAVLPVVTGDGAVLRPPQTPDLRSMTGNDCRTLADEDWTAACGTFTAKDASLVWLIESMTTTSGRTARRALVLRRSAGSTWSVVLQFHDDAGVRFSSINARVADLSGDGKDEVAFGFHAGDTSLSVDVVEGPGSVVVHRDLSRGVARVSSGQLDTWRRVDPARHAHETIQFRDGAWRIVASSVGPSSEVPPSQL